MIHLYIFITTTSSIHARLDMLLNQKTFLLHAHFIEPLARLLSVGVRLLVASLKELLVVLLVKCDIVKSV